MFPPESWPRRVLAVLADGLADPLLELHAGEVVVVDPALVSRVVGRVEVDAVHETGVGRKQALECEEVVAFDDGVAAQRRLLRQREFLVDVEHPVGNDAVVGLDRGLAFELEDWHRAGV